MRRIEILGKLVSDATIYIPQNSTNNRSCINIIVAVNERFVKDGNRKDTVHYYNCAIWKDNTKIADYLKKGTLVFLEGLPIAHVYEKDGKHIGQIKIEVKNIELLSASKKEGQGNDSNNSQSGDIDDSDLPF
jgi:single-strand DNA-binding protein